MAEANIYKIAKWVAEEVIQKFKDDGLFIGKWIPVSERLPEVDVDVFVTDNGGGVPTVTMDACGMKDDTGERFWYVSQTPIAWMSLPEQYKAESEDEE